MGLPPATGRTPPWVWQPQRRTPVGVGARRSSARVLFSGLNQMGVGERRSSARRRVPGKLLWEGTGEERSPATGHVVSDQPGGNCDAMGSARSVVASQPERVESAVPLLFVQQLCRSRGETAGACHARQPQCEGTAKQVTAPPVCPIGKGMPWMPCPAWLPPPYVSPWGGITPWVGYLVERTVILGNIPRGRPSGEQGSIPVSWARAWRPTGTRGCTRYCGTS